jgi:glutamate 5-kinase
MAFVISSLINQGLEVILVSSGAMGFGLNVLNLDKRPSEVARQQAISSVGQVAMMSIYSQIFSHYQTQVSQILLTRDVVEYPESLDNVTNAFERLLEIGVLPIVNENDAVAIDEIGIHTTIGENDSLSAIVARLVKADLLVLLSDIDGLYTADPRVDSNATLIPEVKAITPEILSLAGGTGSALGSGGMATKLKAA